MIKREHYLQQIRGFYESDLIKVIAGMRRSGKSVLLSQIIAELKDNGVSSAQIISLNFESLEFSNITDAKSLNNYIIMHIINQEKYYVFLDEIQKVQEFDNAVNSLRATQNVSLFITGSSGKLLSAELPTSLSGRYVSFYVLPFTFAEVLQCQNASPVNSDATFQKYLKWGGMPQLFSLASEDDYLVYLQDLFNSIILKDIVERTKLNDVDLLNRIIQFIIENVGHIFSANSITKFLKNERIGAAPNKIYQYLAAIESSLIVSRVNRYDIRGKRVIQFYDKFYMTDLGLMQLKKSSYEQSSSGRLENIVYSQLKASRSEIYIGDIDSKEVDFVVKDAGGITYIQVAETLSSDEIIKREFGVFNSISDNFRKVVLSLDKIDHTRNGIEHINLLDWLQTQSLGH